MTQPPLPFDGSLTGAVGRAAPAEGIEGPDSPIAFVFVRSPRARRYILRLRQDGVVRVTIPPRGTRREALELIERHRRWIETQWRQRLAERRAQHPWQDGTRILFRGREVALSVRAAGDACVVRFADQALRLPTTHRVRDGVEQRLRALAETELEPRVRAFARQHGVAVKRVTVRNQRTRWGSCSRRGSISLNWRLVQMPAFVADYIMLHELMHMRQANHSRRFWREVEKVCPGFRDAEAWLRRRGRSLW